MTTNSRIKAARERAHDEKREFRYRVTKVEMRAADESTPRHLDGHASVFNTDAPIGDPDDPWWIERVARGTFIETIQVDDVRALFNHNADLLLGRNKANTLRLAEDDIGLRSIIVPGDTNAGRDMIAHVDRGDVTQMSYGFVIRKHDDERWVELPNGLVHRTIMRVQLWDVSPVTFAAFPTTDVAVREARAQGLLPTHVAPKPEGRALSLARAQLAIAERSI